MSVINIGDDTSAVHQTFIGWLNGLLDSYRAGFWDSAVDAMVTGAFITKTYGHIQELYSPDGKTLMGFATITPTNSANTGLMIHPTDGSDPYMYTYDDIHLLYQYDADGIFQGFTANNTIDLFNADGGSTHEAYIGYNDFWGIKLPFLYIVEKATSQKVMWGAIDAYYDNRESPSYGVKNVPVDTLRILHIRNTRRVNLRVDFPVFKGYFMELDLAPNNVALIPSTDLARSFAIQLKEMGTISYVEKDPS